MTQGYQKYYVPEQSPWPIVGAVGLGLFVIGAASFVQGATLGPYLFGAGVLVICYMVFGWFRHVIEESHAGLYSKQMDRSFRWGMVWFIFSEVMFFAAFFGALFYARGLVVPWLGGEGHKVMTHQLLWDNFTASWPLLNNPNPAKFANPNEAMGAWGLPALNTLILLTSGATITFAHHALLKNMRQSLIIWLLATVLLGAIFLILQVIEYRHAYHELGLTLNSGIYGTTFFMLTGFHGAHVTLGTIMMLVIWFRCLKGHFNPKQHFAFEAVAWYWHFVDVVWLFLFVFVYWL